jgi:hypothetical protein
LARAARLSYTSTMPRLVLFALGGLAVVVAPTFAAPRGTIERYAVLATEGIRARSLTVTNGDLGVNLGRIVVTGGLMAPGSQLVADSVRIVGPATCAGVYGDQVRGAPGSCPASGSDGGALFDDPADACGAPRLLPACDDRAKIVVSSGQSRTLVPGVYGDLKVGGAAPAVVDLVGGRYVFCSLRAVQNASLRVHAPSEIVVAGSLALDRGSTLGAAPDTVVGPSDVRIVVGGRSAKVVRGSSLAARVCAPGARLAFRDATYHGTAVARRVRAAGATLEAPYTEDREPCAQRSRLRKVYFGDLHVHTTLSFDAYAFDVRTTPAQAYAFAQGVPVALPPLDTFGVGTQTLAIDRPLDFVALTDHSEFLGEVQLCTTPGSSTYGSTECQNYRLGGNQGTTYFGTRLALSPPVRSADVCGAGNAYCLTEATEVWSRVQQAAADAYDRTAACGFTSFVGYEYTASQAVSTLHRNVIFRSDHVPFPTTVFEEPTRQGLWTELRATCLDAGIGCDVLVIPHNPNESNGKMFQVEYPGAVTLEDQRAQARFRSSIEPLLEVYQHKGASECLAGISGIVGATDEQCGFEQRYLPAYTDCGDGTGSLGTITLGCTSRRDYLRGILLEGMGEDLRLGENPFRVGVVGSTDTHNGTPGAVAEETFIGNRGTDDGLPADRLGEGQFYRGGWRFSPGGLTAVWAEENARPAIFDALRRREVYGTSGPRLAVRLFAGFGLAADLCTDPDMVEKGYAGGVPMGGVLGSPPAGAAPSFLVSALMDPGTASRPGTPLQRVQIVKLWVDAGVRHEQVYDVAGDAMNGATVDDTTCERSGPGSDTLCSVWTDPDFDPGVHAAYYARVLENPSCRWSTLQCNALAPADRPPSCSDPVVARTVQERAWTSPVWYEPSL